MADLKNLDLNHETIEIPHDFETDIRTLVTINHKLTLEGISRGEQEAIDNFDDDDEEVCQSHRQWQENFSEDLRRAANHLALVGLVTRFQYWINKFAQELPNGQKPQSNQLPVVKGLRVLSRVVGQSPVELSFFEDLVDVRDSIIHHNSTTEKWTYGGRDRCVKAHFINSWGALEVSEEQLKKAIENVTEQLKWYYEKTAPAKRPPHPY